MNAPSSNPDAEPARIMVVEDDPAVRDGLAHAIAQAPDMTLNRVVASRSEALNALGGLPADVLIVDLGLPDGSGIDVIHWVRKAWPACAIMVFTSFGDEAHLFRSLEAGAVGYLLKDASPAKIVEEIRSLRAGGSPINPMIARLVLQRFAAGGAAAAPLPRPEPPEDALSPREKEVLQLITKGFSADEIAKLLALSRHTVVTYIRRIYAKLEVRSKAEAIFEARRLGLLEQG